MHNKYVLCLDQGGSSNRALVFDAKGRVVASHQQPVSVSRSGNRVEQDPMAIVSSLKNCANKVVEQLNLEQRSALTSIGLITQRSSMLAVNKMNGVPLSPVLSWQDTRAIMLIPSDEKSQAFIYQQTGLRPNGHFGASKMAWLLKNNKNVQRAAEQKQLLFVPLAAYITWHLVAGQRWCVDRGNGSRTLLMDVHKGCWDDELLALFNINRSYLPELVASDIDFGEVELAHGSLPMQLLTGDQCAAVYAGGAISDKQVSINVGTGAFIFMPAKQSNCIQGLLNSVIHWGQTSGASYSLEAAINGAASAISYVAENLKCDINFNDIEKALIDSEGLPLFINTVSGLGSPYWRTDIEPCFGSDKGAADTQYLAAVLESIVFLIVRNLEVMTSCGDIEVISISGGLSRSDQLCQRISDLSGVVVMQSEEPEASAKGAAYLLMGSPADWPQSKRRNQFKPSENLTVYKRYRLWLQELESRLATTAS